MKMKRDPPPAPPASPTSPSSVTRLLGAARRGTPRRDVAQHRAAHRPPRARGPPPPRTRGGPGSPPPSLVAARAAPILRGALEPGSTSVRDTRGGGADFGPPRAAGGGSRSPRPPARGCPPSFPVRAPRATGGRGDTRARPAIPGPSPRALRGRTDGPRDVHAGGRAGGRAGPRRGRGAHPSSSSSSSRPPPRDAARARGWYGGRRWWDDRTTARPPTPTRWPAPSR